MKEQFEYHHRILDFLLLVNVPCSTVTITNAVAVRCGHCANLLSFNTGALLQTSHLQNVHKQNLPYQDLSEGSPSSSKGNKASLSEPSQNEQPSRKLSVHAAVGKKSRTPLVYNRFIKEEIRRLKAKNPEIRHRKGFSTAAKNVSWEN